MTNVNNDKIYQLHYDTPAADWNEALPIGNGRLGAMVFGDVIEERYQINEDTFWSGFPRDTNNYEAIRHLKRARALIDQEQYSEAESLIETKMLSVNCQAYQVFANLWMRLQNSRDSIEQYNRKLNISEAIVSSEATMKGLNIKKEAWASAVHNVLALHVQSSTEHALDIELEYNSPHPYQLLESPYLSVVMNAPTHISDIHLQKHPNPIHYETNRGIKANCIICAKSDGEILYSDNRIVIKQASWVTYYVTIKTSFIAFDTAPHQDEGLLVASNMDTLSKIEHLSYSQLKHAHIADYQSLFNRVSFSLYSNIDEPLATTVQQLQAYRQNQNNKLEELYFHYARYLLISASRKGTQATNLQGIWNEHVTPPWFSNYTLNINTEMNYWAVEAVSLPECAEPLHRLIKELAVTGERTAKIHYNARGWTAHHNTDIWRMSTPTSGSPSWAFWPMSAMWLCQHLWEHYLYCLDLTFLREEAFPLMKGAALFALDWLVEDSDGKLITTPSSSPENIFIHDEQKSSVAKGSSMDLTLIAELFEHVLQASELLHIDDEVTAEIKESLKKLAVPSITDDGRLVEWIKPFDEAEPGHRHVSHLYGIYPGTWLLEKDYERYSNAARRSLQYRIEHGGGHTGWSCAWLINLFARLEDGEQAHYYIQQLLSRSTYINLFDAHPPFQIDGNFGGLAGMLEMIVQSHLNRLALLPALPNAWKQGELKGVAIRGGFKLNIRWENHQLKDAVLLSEKGMPFSLKNSEHYIIEEIETNQQLDSTHKKIQTKPHYHYRIVLKQ